MYSAVVINCSSMRSRVVPSTLCCRLSGVMLVGRGGGGLRGARIVENVYLSNNEQKNKTAISLHDRRLSPRSD